MKHQNIQILPEDALSELLKSIEFISIQDSEEVQNLRQRMEDFCQVYFHGDTEIVKGFLSASYHGDIDVYGNPGEDSMTYLSVTFVNENGERKASFYGLKK